MRELLASALRMASSALTHVECRRIACRCVAVIANYIFIARIKECTTTAAAGVLCMRAHAGVCVCVQPRLSARMCTPQVPPVHIHRRVCLREAPHRRRRRVQKAAQLFCPCSEFVCERRRRSCAHDDVVARIESSIYAFRQCVCARARALHMRCTCDAHFGVTCAGRRGRLRMRIISKSLCDSSAKFRTVSSPPATATHYVMCECECV